MTKKDEPSKRIERRLPLTETRLKIMLTTFIRKLSAFLVAKTQLRPEHFNKGEQGYALIWATVLDHYEEIGKLPQEHELLAEIDLRLQEDTDALDDDEISEVDKFVQTAFHGVKRQDLSDQLAAKYLRVFLEDRLADRAREIFQLGTRNPSDIFQLATNLAEEAGSIRALSGAGVQQPFPSGWDEQAPPVEKLDTDTACFNHFLNGGDSPGEVYGLLGPFGSAKTTTAIYLSVLRANRFWQQWVAGGRKGPLPLVYYFFYEGSLPEMRVRALAAIGQIDKETLESVSWDKLSYDRETLKPYELKLFARELAAGATVHPEESVPGKAMVWPERSRKKFAETILNRNWRPIDMTGNDPANPGRGWGMADELVSIVRQDQLFNYSRGLAVCCGTVYVDFLLALVDAYMTHNNIKQHEELRLLVQRYPLHVKNRLALAFRCPVWILHQLSGAANSLPPGVIPKITDSAEGKSFAMHLDFCFQYGGKTAESLCVLACGKSRRAPPHTELVVRVDGALGAIRSTDGKWVLDTMAKKIVCAADLRKVDGGSRAIRPFTEDNSARTQSDR